jgi:DNA processing protein
MAPRDLQEDRVRNHTAGRQPLLPPEELAVYHNLSPYPEHIDTLIRKTHIESGKLLSLLLQLELKGIVQQLPGKYFALSETTSGQKERS